MENETKKCKYCQSDIPKKAKVCPNCRKKQSGKGKIIAIVIIVIVIIGIASCASCTSSLVKSLDDDDVKVTTPAENQSDDESANTEQTENTDQSDDSEQQADDKKDESTDDKLTVGSTIEKNGLKITINDASTDFTDYEDEYGFNTPSDGMKYVMASFTFENTGSSDEYVSIYDFKCYADNTECEQVYSLDDSGFINTNLSSGRNVSFKTYYSVPVDAQTIELEYETNMWTGKKVVITLQ